MRKIPVSGQTILVGAREELFAALVEEILETANCQADGTVGLSGGATPREFYRWVVERRALSRAAVASLSWAVSDERAVPLADERSNFGTASRLLLDPLGLRPERRHPWPVDQSPAEAARAFAAAWAERFGPARAFDLGLLGLGEDGHTASIFPGSPLLAAAAPDPAYFATAPGPGGEPRLTITPAGLAACGKVVVLVTGPAKAGILRRVLRDPPDPASLPAQLLRALPGAVLWLVDESAAGGIED